MQRFKKSLGVGFVITFFVMCFEYGFAVLQALVQGTDVVQAALNSVVLGFVLWGLFTYALYSFYGYIEERDARDAAERQARLNPPPEKPEGRDENTKQP